MKLKFVLIAAILSIFMSSCVFTLFPIYTEDSIIYDENLVGTWQDNSTAKDQLIIEGYPNSERPHYKMQVISDGVKDSAYEVHLTGIGDKIYMDLYPWDGGSEEVRNLIAVHTFMHVDLSKNQLGLRYFDEKKMMDLFKSNLIRLKHEVLEDYVLITAQPKEIQKFIHNYASNEEVFDSRNTYTKL